MHALLPRSFVAATVLVPALVLSACASDGEGDRDIDDAWSTGATAAAETVDQTSPPDDDATAAGGNTGEDDVLLFDDITPILDAARDEFGDIEVTLLQIYPEQASMTQFNPAAPNLTIRHIYSDGAWTDRTRIPHASSGTSMSLDEIDPDLVRTATRAAPGEIGVEDAQIDHVAIGFDDAGDLGYLVSLTWDEGLGSVTFAPDGEVREVKSYQ